MDGVEEISVPLPDDDEDSPSSVLEQIVELHESEIDEAEQKVSAILNEVATSIGSSIEEAASDAAQSLALVTGQVDADLLAHEDAVARVLSRYLDAILRQLIAIEVDLTEIGVSLPSSTAEYYSDLADTSGQTIISRVLGAVPGTGGVGSPAAPPAAVGEVVVRGPGFDEGDQPQVVPGVPPDADADRVGGTRDESPSPVPASGATPGEPPATSLLSPAASPPTQQGISISSSGSPSALPTSSATDTATSPSSSSGTSAQLTAPGYATLASGQTAWCVPLPPPQCPPLEPFLPPGVLPPTTPPRPVPPTSVTPLSPGMPGYVPGGAGELPAQQPGAAGAPAQMPAAPPAAAGLPAAGERAAEQPPVPLESPGPEAEKPQAEQPQAAKKAEEETQKQADIDAKLDSALASWSTYGRLDFDCAQLENAIQFARASWQVAQSAFSAPGFYLANTATRSGRRVSMMSSTLASYLPGAVLSVFSSSATDAYTAQVVQSTLADLFLADSLSSFSVDAVDGAALRETMHRLALAVTAERQSGAPVSYLATHHQYLVQYLMPRYLPTQAEIDTLWIYDVIDDRTWECATRALGNLPAWHRAVRDAKTIRPNLQDLIDLYLRGKIDWPELARRSRQVGLTNGEYLDEFLKLREYVPTPPDLVRFMVRDVFDEKVAREWRYDQYFDEKWAGKADEWARAFGMTRDVARAYWRAHWELPSPTQLYEMLHRLRPDRPNADIVVTAEQVRRALEINDILPHFVDALMAISYHPVTRTDALDAYYAGIWGDDELYHAMRDNGYNDADAKRLVEIARKKKQRRFANLSGVWTVRKIVREYKAGVLNWGQADNLLAEQIPSADERRKILRFADLEANAEVTTAQVREIRRGFFTGAFDAQEAANRLKLALVDAGRIPQLIEKWRAERDGRFREPAARQVTQWLAYGIVTAEECLARLKRLGYPDEDARRMTMLGLAQQRDRISAQLRRMQADAKRAAEERKKLAAKTLAELEKLRKQFQQRVKEIEEQIEKYRELQEKAGQAEVKSNRSVTADRQRPGEPANGALD